MRLLRSLLLAACAGVAGFLAGGSASFVIARARSETFGGETLQGAAFAAMLLYGPLGAVLASAIVGYAAWRWHERLTWPITAAVVLALGVIGWIGTWAM